jgi:hypothetical protein
VDVEHAALEAAHHLQRYQLREWWGGGLEGGGCVTESATRWHSRAATAVVDTLPSPTFRKLASST